MPGRAAGHDGHGPGIDAATGEIEKRIVDKLNWFSNPIKPIAPKLVPVLTIPQLF